MNAHKIDAILDDLNEVSGIDGIILANEKVEIIRQKWNSDSAALEQFQSLIKNAVEIIQAFAGEISHAKLDSMLHEGTFGKIFIIAMPEHNLIVIIFGNSTLNVGMAKATVDQYAKSSSSQKL
ncbi:roadblock/LC7 domain-containing protein [candidate division KSB1 bacterium]|nr:roadblock/LC7 domain-containing protein [candidate division KSB1 bacterium]